MSNFFLTNLFNIPGYRTKRRLIILESDDWGAVRTSSIGSLQRLKKAGISVEKCHYLMNDGLASESDLNDLFSILSEVKNYNGQNPIITANVLVANPDFAAIREANYKEYINEPLPATFSRYPQHSSSLKIWEQGYKERLFHPQSHGREHLNISRWMRDLQLGLKHVRTAFDCDMFGISSHLFQQKSGSYLAAFDGGINEITVNRKRIVGEALSGFARLFGFSSESFIAPNYIWNDEVESEAGKNGVRFFQGTRVQRLPADHGEKRVIKRHSLGKKNSHGQIFLIRNCEFEPSASPTKDWINSCLKEINTAFFWEKPAIISTHRVNFVGFINPENKNRNLPLFKQLLKEIVKRWPDVEFMTSDQLGRLISEQKYG